jgi:hypothetical protein|tara:strand:- start:589 stop:1428 length:840 start_codon:yes stop_codon:yes gene_type:complete
VNELEVQCSSLNIDFEIRCYEDGSSKEWANQNIALQNKLNVNYQIIQKNLGRSAIRNKMSAEAKYDWQLFFDCDAEISNSNFIKNYVSFCSEKPCVVFGGRSYADSPPKETDKLLRWKYGVEREVFSIDIRNTAPYKYFMTNNFLVHRSIVESIQFNTDITGYGHEDTMFAIDLKNNKTTLHHINNPLLHIGLETSSEFLSKTKQGVKNLALLIKNKNIDKENKLYKTYDNIKSWHSIWIINFSLYILLRLIVRNLKSSNPNIKMFDLFKLKHLLNYFS